MSWELKRELSILLLNFLAFPHGFLAMFTDFYQNRKEGSRTENVVKFVLKVTKLSS